MLFSPIAIIKSLLPPPRWRLPALLVTAVIVGLAGSLFHVSKASSYLSDDPKTCINCHIMLPQYTTWKHSSHKNVTTCNDCHVPQNNIFRKYFFKAKDGSRHSALFTLRMEEEVIRISTGSKAVVQENCVRCHTNTNENVSTQVTLNETKHGQGKLCWQCHREVPHGRVHSLSSVPNASMQLKTPKLPNWMNKTGVKE